MITTQVTGTSLTTTSGPAASASGEFPGVDLDMLAYDIADMLDRCEYPIDVADSHIRPALPAFIAAILANAAADDDDWEDEAAQGGGPGDPLASPGDLSGPVPDVPFPQRGRAPAMTYLPWHTTQGIELGATAEDKWYWRCPVQGCRIWAGPYRNLDAAKAIGMDHRYAEHDLPAERRTEARKAARRVCHDMTAARLDDIVAQLTAAYDLPAAKVQTAIRLSADAIDGLHSTGRDALFYIGKDIGNARNGDYGLTPHPRVTALISAICAELGHPGWLEEDMAADARR